MRKMMEGVVLYGTGKAAQLNGYSSGGKTGTAQKVDPVTHLYSKTMHVASFAGIAPVNNPVIAVAVVMDNPKGASYYGTAVSAPVFAEVAQQVLEYLSVPHDIDMRPPKTPLKQPRPKSPSTKTTPMPTRRKSTRCLPRPMICLPTIRCASRSSRAATGASASCSIDSDRNRRTRRRHNWTQRTASNQPRRCAVASAADAPTYVTISDGKKLSVPTLVGLPIRNVIEMTAAAGLQVQITGSGTVREQAPAPGTQVPSGTKIMVRCGR